MFKNFKIVILFILIISNNVFAIVNSLNSQNYDLIIKKDSVKSKFELNKHDRMILISEIGTEEAFQNLITRTNDSKKNFGSLFCSTMPTLCSKYYQFKNRFFHNGVFEARGPKDLIAIVSTMLATILGAILVKLNVLIVLSVISVAIGKLLLMIFAFKSQIFSHKTHHPVIYEKVYQPQHKESISYWSNPYHEEYPTYS